jgi:hypothetical protein
MRRANLLLSAVAMLGAVVLPGVRSAADDRANDTRIRIGTYDNRAITLAYVASRFHSDLMAEKMAAHKKAKDAGDQAKMKELEAWARQYQHQLHLQGFGRAPVDDLLELVKGKVAQLARDKKLAAVTMSCDFTDEQVEVVDITEDLVMLFDPPEKEGTLQTVRELRKTKPAKLTELPEDPAKY